MRLKTWAPVVLAIVLGGGAAMIFRNMMLKPRTPVAGLPKTMHVVAANNDLIVGQALRADNLTTMEIPNPDKPVDYCSNPAVLLGRVVNKPVEKGQFIKESDLAPVGASGGILTYIPAGMRAMTIPVDEGNSQAGMLLPGCHVDVIGTFPNGRKSVTRTLIRNVLVQAVGTRLTSARPEDGKDPGPYHTATLIVTPREAQIIDLTTNSGRMRLLLRGLVRADNETAPPDVTPKDITPDVDDAPTAAVGPTTRSTGSELADAPQQPKKFRVEMIKQGATTIVEFDMNHVVPPQEATNADLLKPQIPGNENEGD